MTSPASLKDTPTPLLEDRKQWLSREIEWMRAEQKKVVDELKRRK